jgi:hypothetical protein
MEAINTKYYHIQYSWELADVVPMLRPSWPSTALVWKRKRDDKAK